MSTTPIPPEVQADADRAASDAFAGTPNVLPGAGGQDDLVERMAMLLGDLMKDTLMQALNDHLQVIRALDALGDDAIVTRKDAAKLLGIHINTLQRLEREGHLPAPGQLGGTIVYSIGAIRAIARMAAGGRNPAAAVRAKSPGRPGRGSKRS